MFEEYKNQFVELKTNFNKTQEKYFEDVKNIVVTWGETFIFEPLKKKGLTEQEINFLYDKAFRKASQYAEPSNLEAIYSEMQKLVKEKHGVELK